MRRVAWIVPWLLPGLALADPIVDRDYAIELYEGMAVGDSTQTGTGGAGAARILGSAGALINASAPAVRKTTDNSGWSWDYHLDALSGRLSTDYDNNGISSVEGSGTELLTGGFALRIGTWAFAITGTTLRAPVDGSDPALEAKSHRGKLVIAKFIPSTDVAVGIGVQAVTFALGPPDNDDEDARLFAVSGASLVGGLTWLPRGKSFRFAAAAESKIIGADVDADCDPMDCNGFILPNTVESPERIIVGGAYRFAKTPWNQQVPTTWRDEFSVMAVADIVIAGTSTNGNGLEGFAMRELQPTGRSTTLSVRAGAEVEAMPSRLRVRVGSYWEPGRFEGVGGRVHGTLGFELRLLEFYLVGERRLKIGGTLDVASDYRNVGVSIGFWHGP